MDDCQRDVTKVRVDPSVTSLDARAFYNWRYLQTIILPHTITTIGNWVFDGCSSLTEITLPNSITAIGNNVFYGCTSLASITLPNSITTLGDWVFFGCSSLTSVTLPNSITKIGDGVFSRCSSLIEITLPNSITALGYRFFHQCSSLSSITLPNSITTFGKGVFWGCSSLTVITLPNSITTIDHWAFYGCSSLASVHLPENLISISLISISITAFEGCVNLTTIEAPYLSTTTLDNNNLDSFKNLLLNAGFSTSNPEDIISDRQPMDPNLDFYYNWKRWARTRDVDDRYPVFTAAVRCLKWPYMKQIFTSNMPVVNEIDVLTGLPLFMLAATGPTSDIESVYNLLRECPAAMNIMNNSHD